jgi:hypothetical protein
MLCASIAHRYAFAYEEFLEPTDPERAPISDRKVISSIKSVRHSQVLIAEDVIKGMRESFKPVRRTLRFKTTSSLMTRLVTSLLNALCFLVGMLVADIILSLGII